MKILLRLYRKLLHGLDNHGLHGLLRRVATRQPLDIDGADPGTHPFDQQYGTDTAGYLPGAQLAAGSPADLYNTAYYGSSPSTLRAALGHLPEPPAGFTFYDLGCGKGRALLVAAALPFERIDGIELVPALAAVARANTCHDPRVHIMQGDAAQAHYPAGPLLVFLYHPFLAPMLKRVLLNLLTQREQQNQPTYLLYSNCTYPAVMRSFAALKPVWDHNFPLSAEDAAAHHFGATEERYQLWKLTPR